MLAALGEIELRAGSDGAKATLRRALDRSGGLDAAMQARVTQLLEGA